MSVLTSDLHIWNTDMIEAAKHEIRALHEEVVRLRHECEELRHCVNMLMYQDKPEVHTR